MTGGKEDRRVLAAILISATIIASILIYSFTTPRYSNPYFPLWILDQNHAAPPQAMNVTVGQPYIFYLGSQNEMGKSEDCILIVKLRNTTQPVPVTSNMAPSDLPMLKNYSFSLENGQQWGQQINFTIFGQNLNNSFLIQQITIGNVSVSLTLQAGWDAIGKGYYCQFIYELWLLNKDSSLYFSGVWVSSPLLNITQ